MPGLYALRSSSSSSSAAKPPYRSHQRPAPTSAAVYAPSVALAPPPTASHAGPAFHKSVNPSFTTITVASAQPIYALQVMDPSAEIVGTRRQGTSGLDYSSSGSPHDPSTVCLAAMVHEFMEEDLAVASCGRARCNCVDGVCGDDESCIVDELPEEPQMQDEQLCEILEGITCCTSKPELLLLVDVARAIEAETEELLAGDDGALAERLRRPVMKRLREECYNAAICKSRWNHGDGLPAGDYEYIDVLVDGKSGSNKQERLIVDIDFKSQFEIARASKQYTQLLSVLPRLFVGRAERLKQILKIMSNAAKRSLKEQGLLLPPWRKHKYMQAKWFAQYRRTTNAEPVQSPHRVLRLGVKAPKILSLDFTKEMDLLFYKAQLRGHQHNQHNLKRDHLVLHVPAAPGGVAMMRAGFANNPIETTSLAHRDICTAVCTDWQLPVLDDKCKGNRDRVSGISNAFKQESFSSKQTSRVAIVSAGS